MEKIIRSLERQLFEDFRKTAVRSLSLLFPEDRAILELGPTPYDSKYERGCRALFSRVKTSMDLPLAAVCFINSIRKNERYTVSASAKLGIMYITGTGLIRNAKKGIRLLGYSAKKGHRVAAYTLAVLYDIGYGTVVPKDSLRSSRWYRQAAHLGETAALTRLGFCYQSIGNVEKALALYREAAEEGDGTASCKLGFFCLKRELSSGKELERKKSRAVALFKDAAIDGNPVAWKVLAIGLRSGIFGMVKNEELARRYEDKAYEKAARAGFVPMLAAEELQIAES